MPLEESILKTVKKQLNIADDDASFDLDVITHINSAFSNLHDLGVGPAAGFAIEDDQATWLDFMPPPSPTPETYLPILSRVKTAIYLRVRMLFDPPDNPALVSATQKAIDEADWRLSVARETTDWVDPDPPVLIVVDEEV